MEQVFPVGAGLPSPPMDVKHAAEAVLSADDFKVAVIERVFEPGNFLVVLDNGLRVKAKGSGALKKGNKVRIRMPVNEPDGVEKPPARKNLKTVSEDGFQLSAMIPLAFGGKKAKARLEVFVERQMEGARDPESPATYFVFSVQTESNGEIQWSVHMKGKQVTLQVFWEFGGAGKEKLKDMVREVENSLKKRGFIIMTPTVFLSRSFQIPPGFRLNVTG